MNVIENQILFLGAHCDDIEIGCGGTAAKLNATGRAIAFAVAADCGHARRQEAIAAAATLHLSEANGTLFLGLIPDGRLEERKDVLQNWLKAIVEKFQPDIVFVHHGADTHPDHEALYRVSIRVFNRESLLLYPIPKLAAQATPFQPSHYEDISDFMKEKLGLCACHGSQAGKGVYLDPEQIKDTARMVYRSAYNKSGGYAEAFRIHVSRSSIRTPSAGVRQRPSRAATRGRWGGESQAGGSGLVQRILWPKRLSEYQLELADRKRELIAFQRILSGKVGQRILLLHGDSSKGKSVLLREFVRYAEQLQITVAGVDFKGCGSLVEGLNTLAAMLELDSRPNPGDDATSGELLKIHLIHHLKNFSTPTVLWFDGYDLHEWAQKWIEGQFLQLLVMAPAVLVVISGKRAPVLECVQWGRLAESRELGPIRSTKAWHDFIRLGWPGLKLRSSHVRNLVLAVHGNPLKVRELIEGLAAEKQVRSTLRY